MSPISANFSGNIEMELPPIATVIPQIVNNGESLLVSIPNKEVSAGNVGKKPRRYTKHAKLNGDRAEEIVFNFLTASNRYQKIRWVAKDKLTPGWDLEYSHQGETHFIEVKGTSGVKFPSIDITANEWNAAKNKRKNYSLYLVANCLGSAPKIEIINNPYELFEKAELKIEPLTWSITR